MYSDKDSSFRSIQSHCLLKLRVAIEETVDISMSFLTGSRKHSWQPVMGEDTTTAHYWFNIRWLLCIFWVILSLVITSLLISRKEGSPKSKDGDIDHDAPGILYEDDVWKPSFKNMHPGWLLTFRAIAFGLLIPPLALDIFVEGFDILFFYTQWTFVLVTMYFGIGTVLSIYGCYKLKKEVGESKALDVEKGALEVSSVQSETSNVSNTVKLSGKIDEHPREIAGFWGYAFQIMYPMAAGAVVLTDCVFWCIIYPFLLDHTHLNFFTCVMHTVNAIFILIETVLNSLRLPWFRIAYFFLYTTVFVVFQWVLHANFWVPWPYPFLDIKDPFAPVWYLAVGLMHGPCYAFYYYIIKYKRILLSKRSRESNQSS